MNDADGTRADVLVVGGGVAGLSCAVALSDAGLRTIVLEASAVLGGRARSWPHAATGDTVDIGPHVVHSEYANFLKFLERCGTRECITWQPQPVITIATTPAFRLRRHALPPPLEVFPDMLHAPGLKLRDILSNMKPSLRALQLEESRLHAFDAMTGLDWLLSCGATPAMIDWFWRLASLATMNVPLERCSAAALMRVHAQITGHRGFHFGFPQVGLSDLYVDQSVAIIESADGCVVFDSRAARSEREGDGHVVTTDDGRRFAARHLVYAVPPAELRELDATLSPSSPIEPSPYKSIYLWFDRPITHELFWAQQPAPGRLNCDFYNSDADSSGAARRSVHHCEQHRVQPRGRRIVRRRDRAPDDRGNRRIRARRAQSAARPCGRPSHPDGDSVSAAGIRIDSSDDAHGIRQCIPRRRLDCHGTSLLDGKCRAIGLPRRRSRACARK